MIEDVITTADGAAGLVADPACLSEADQQPAACGGRALSASLTRGSAVGRSRVMTMPPAGRTARVQHRPERARRIRIRSWSGIVPHAATRSDASYLFA
jgi:hypothetical protein